MDSTVCDHSITVDDDSTATEICTECGLVITEGIISLRQYSEEIKKMPPMPRSDDESVLRSDILNMLALFNQDSPFMADEVYSFLQKSIDAPGERNRCINKGFLAFAMWETLSRHGRAYSPLHIANTCQIPIHQLQEAEREFEISPLFCPPSLFSHRMCTAIGMDYPPVQMLVQRSVNVMDDYVRRPEVIVGSIMCELGRSLKMYNNLDLPQLKPCHVAKVLGVSMQSMRKFSVNIDPCRVTLEEGRKRLNLNELSHMLHQPTMYI